HGVRTGRTRFREGAVVVGRRRALRAGAGAWARGVQRAIALAGRRRTGARAVVATGARALVRSGREARSGSRGVRSERGRSGRARSGRGGMGSDLRDGVPWVVVLGWVVLFG